MSSIPNFILGFKHILSSFTDNSEHGRPSILLPLSGWIRVLPQITAPMDNILGKAQSHHLLGYLGTLAAFSPSTLTELIELSVIVLQKKMSPK